MSFEVAKEIVLLCLMVKMGRDRVGAGIPRKALCLGRVRRGVPVIKCPLLGDGWHPIGCPSLGTGDINPAPASQARTLIACKDLKHPCFASLAEQSWLQRLFSIRDDARRCLSRHVCWWGWGCHSRGATGAGDVPGCPCCSARPGGIRWCLSSHALPGGCSAVAFLTPALQSCLSILGRVIFY